MGRYYSGDINGRFWFGIQPSDAPARFGCYDDSATTLHYSITMDEIDQCKEELDRIRKNIKEIWNIDADEMLKKFNEHHNDPNFSLGKEANINDEATCKQFYAEFADFDLGMKIYNCLLENGECNFDAEL